MEIAFESKELRKLCEIEDHAIQALGTDVAKSLRHRIADLRAAGSPNELIAGSPKLMDDSDNGKYAVSLSNNSKLIFCSNHINPPRTNTGKLDWPNINRIKILSIHD